MNYFDSDDAAAAPCPALFEATRDCSHSFLIPQSVHGDFMTDLGRVLDPNSYVTNDMVPAPTPTTSMGTA